MPRGVNQYDEAQLQGRLWTPALFRPALWLDADDLSAISIATGVSEWRDKGPNARNVTQGTGGTQPTLTTNGLNGRNVLSFNGSQYLTSPAATSTWNFLHNTNGSSVFAVWKAGNVSNPNTLYGLMGTNAIASVNAGLALIYDDRSSSSRNDRVICTIERAVGGGSAATNLSADNAHPSNTPVILSHIGDPNNATAANRSSIRVNRGAAIQLNASTLAPSASNASFTLQIGACGNNQIPMVGYIAEIVVLASIASTQVRQQIEGYLAWKWGLQASLSADSPFLNRPPVIGD
jgi:hypothetical protein